MWVYHTLLLWISSEKKGKNCWCGSSVRFPLILSLFIFFNMFYQRWCWWEQYIIELFQPQTVQFKTFKIILNGTFIWGKQIVLNSVLAGFVFSFICVCFRAMVNFCSYLVCHQCGPAVLILIYKCLAWLYLVQLLIYLPFALGKYNLHYIKIFFI